MTVEWDEASHLNGAQILQHGNTQRYMRSSMFYPPLDDLITAGYFTIGGTSVITARLVSVTFAVLVILIMFEFVYRTYGPKIALVSSILLATMPGFVWGSRLAMIETMLIFFFSASLILFYFWLQKHENKYLFLSGITLGLGFLTKYQTVIAVLAMLASVLLLHRKQIKAKLARIPIIVLIAIIVAVPWIIVSYQVYSTGMLGTWMYALQTGNPDKLAYGIRFGPYITPVFYLIEMTWPYGSVHPISFFVYCFSLAGIGLFLWRRNPQDKFLLAWFFVVYIFFTLIGNKQWRYVLPIFPVLAISGANLITSLFEKIQRGWNQTRNGHKRILSKTVALGLVAIVTFSVFYSGVDAYTWIQKDGAFKLPIVETVHYVASMLNSTSENDSLVVLCPSNVLTRDIVTFYLHSEGFGRTYVGNYPEEPVDAYPPNFNMAQLTMLCEQHNVKYLLLFEYGRTYPYFNSTLNMETVYQMVVDSQNFEFERDFGQYPFKIYVFSFG